MSHRIAPYHTYAIPICRENICKVKAPLYLINNLQITIIVWQKLSAAREVRPGARGGCPLPPQKPRRDHPKPWPASENTAQPPHHPRHNRRKTLLPQVLVQQEAADVFLAALAAIVLHFIFLTFNIIVTWLLRFPEAERKAIIIMASQKNLPTAATIISYFDSSVGNLGLITIPCIVFYIMQVGLCFELSRIVGFGVLVLFL